MSRQQAFRAEYRRRRPGWRDSTTLYRELVERAAGPGRILDVGCGRRDVLRDAYARAALAVGIDPDAGALRQNAVLQAKVLAVAERLPFRDASFDLAACLWVAEHLDDPLGVFREIHRVLTPGGRFILLTPNAWNYTTWLIRLVPNRFHPALTRFAFDREHTSYPTRYRANSVRALSRALAEVGFSRRRFVLNGDPSYVALNRPLFHLASGLERVLDRIPRARVHILVEATKES